VRAAAKAAGLAWRTVERAKAKIGAKAKREGFGRDGKWQWHLPTGSHLSVEVAAYGENGQPCGFPAVGQVALYEAAIDDHIDGHSDVDAIGRHRLNSLKPAPLAIDSIDRHHDTEKASPACPRCGGEGCAWCEAT
jgi:hypothetical protein